jgi:hypothetical protein
LDLDFGTTQTLGRPRGTIEYNIKMDLQDVGSESMDWIALVQDSECGNEPSGSIKCGEFLD